MTTCPQSPESKNPIVGFWYIEKIENIPQIVWKFSLFSRLSLLSYEQLSITPETSPSHGDDEDTRDPHGCEEGEENTESEHESESLDERDTEHIEDHCGSE